MPLWRISFQLIGMAEECSPVNSARQGPRFKVAGVFHHAKIFV